MNNDLRFKNTKNNQVLDFIATWVSRIFSPLLMIPLFILMIVHFSTTSAQLYISLFGFGIFGVLPILGFLILLKKLGMISDWGVNIRRERYVLNAVGLICSLLLLWVFRSTAAWDVIGILFWIIVTHVVFTLFTYLIKVSAHTASITLICLLLSLYLNRQLEWLFLLVPLVIWSRTYLQKHSLLEAGLGIMVGLTPLFLLYLLNYI